MERYLHLDCPLFYAERPAANSITLKVDTETNEYFLIDTINDGKVARNKKFKLATINDIEDISIETESSSSKIQDLEDKIKLLENLLMNTKVATSEIVTSVDKFSQPENNIVVNLEDPISGKSTITGKSITVKTLNQESSTVSMVSEGDIIIQNLSSSGSLEKNLSNAQLNVNSNENVIFSNSTLNQTGYNVIEIGMLKPSKSITIENVEFNGNINNNTISIHNTVDNAIINISNCKFGKCSNILRISNIDNVKATFNIINCEFEEWDQSGEYSGCVICQDFTSKSAEEAVEKNLFAPEKITINFINCKYNGKLITFNNQAEVSGTKDKDTQLIYVYVDKEGFIEYSENRYPLITCK